MFLLGTLVHTKDCRYHFYKKKQKILSCLTIPIYKRTSIRQHLQPLIVCHPLFFTCAIVPKSQPRKNKNLLCVFSLHMERTSISISLLFFFLAGGFNLSSVSARPATFLQDFRITWSDNHIRQLDGGRAIQLTLDQTSGWGFRLVHFIFAVQKILLCVISG